MSSSGGASGGGGGGGVTTFDNRTGAVTLTEADVQGTGVMVGTQLSAVLAADTNLPISAVTTVTQLVIATPGTWLIVAGLTAQQSGAQLAGAAEARLVTSAGALTGSTSGGEWAVQSGAGNPEVSIGLSGIAVVPAGGATITLQAEASTGSLVMKAATPVMGANACTGIWAIRLA